MCRCRSSVGRDGGEQIMYLDSGCTHVGSILHELTHAVGFDHEHNRSDRDEHVRIITENIQPEHLDEFEKLDPANETLIGQFDPNSIMIYGHKVFAINEMINTMETLDESIRLENPTYKTLSFIDIYKINTLYAG
ncbi:hypothetical protein LAZ67_4000979, partial [Cordylochernes scorpioides]